MTSAAAIPFDDALVRRDSIASILSFANPAHPIVMRRVRYPTCYHYLQADRFRRVLNFDAAAAYDAAHPPQPATPHTVAGVGAAAASASNAELQRLQQQLRALMRQSEQAGQDESDQVNPESAATQTAAPELQGGASLMDGTAVLSQASVIPSGGGNPSTSSLLPQEAPTAAATQAGNDRSSVDHRTGDIDDAPQGPLRLMRQHGDGTTRATRAAAAQAAPGGRLEALLRLAARLEATEDAILAAPSIAEVERIAARAAAEGLERPDWDSARVDAALLAAWAKCRQYPTAVGKAVLATQEQQLVYMRCTPATIVAATHKAAKKAAAPTAASPLATTPRAAAAAASAAFLGFGGGMMSTHRAATAADGTSISVGSVDTPSATSVTLTPPMIPSSPARTSPTTSRAVTPTRRAPLGYSALKPKSAHEEGSGTNAATPRRHSPAKVGTTTVTADTAAITAVPAPPTAYLHDAVWSDGGDGSGANLLGVVWMATRKRLQKVVMEEEELARRQKWLEKRPGGGGGLQRPLLRPSSSTPSLGAGARRAPSSGGIPIGNLNAGGDSDRLPSQQPVFLPPRPPPGPQLIRR